jgi:hypothetical protein
MIKQLITIVLLSACVSANVVISQVLYDPLGTESGGEAIELKNIGDSIVDLSDWTISTEASNTDVKIPQSMFINPGQTFLIADSGWSTKRDNAEWRDADLEDTMTLGNSDSGIALKDESENIMDAVGWGDSEGIEDGLFEGVPVSFVAPGKALLRIDNSDDNSEDFIESEPNFFDGVPVLIEADVTVTAPVVEVSDKLELAPDSFLVVKNNRDYPVVIDIRVSNLVFGKNVIAKENVDVEDESFTVQPNEEKKVRVSLKEVGAPPGRYTSILRVKIS